SDAVKRGVASIGVREEQIQVVYNGVDANRFETASAMPLRERFGWTADTILIGFAGQFNENKGVWDFLHAGEIVLKGEARCRFVLIGKLDESNSSVREMRDYLRAHGLVDKIVFSGWVERMERAYAAL